MNNIPCPDKKITIKKFCHVRIGKPVDGWMSFAFLVEGEKGFGKMYVSKIDKRTFLNFTIVDDPWLSENYWFFEYEIKKNRLYVYPFDAYEMLETSASSEEIQELIRKCPREELFGEPSDPVIKFR